MTAKAARAEAAAHDVKRIVADIITRGGEPEYVALDIHAVYAGRYELTPRQTAGQKCPTHTGTALANGICPICGPT